MSKKFCKLRLIFTDLSLFKQFDKVQSFPQIIHTCTHTILCVDTHKHIVLIQKYLSLFSFENIIQGENKNIPCLMYQWQW